MYLVNLTVRCVSRFYHFLPLLLLPFCCEPPSPLAGITAKISYLVLLLLHLPPADPSQYSNWSNPFKTYIRSCLSSAQNPSVEPISHRVKARVLIIACKALCDAYPSHCPFLHPFLPSSSFFLLQIHCLLDVS